MYDDPFEISYRLSQPVLRCQIVFNIIRDETQVIVLSIQISAVGFT